MLKQKSCVAYDRVEIDAAELAGAHAREVEQTVDDLRGAEGLLRNLLEDGLQTRVRCLIGAELLAEHLGIAGDDGQRCVDLVRDAGGEQAYGGELFGLRELRLHVDAIG